MTMNEMRLFLIKELINEDKQYEDIEIPDNIDQQNKLLRTLMNIRPPSLPNRQFLKVQDDYLQKLVQEKGIVAIDDLQSAPLNDKIYLWQGDITQLKVDAVVNAANSQMLGCFHPCHGCIDNAIHTFAGVQLRHECDQMMRRQQKPEPTGMAKITASYNLPCRSVIHTVGPIIHGALTQQDCDLLVSCYDSCLSLAEKNGLASIAFCCISTGEFHFPNQKAAEIAVQTVTSFLKDSQYVNKVVFNVFKSNDRQIYERLLGIH